MEGVLDTVGEERTQASQWPLWVALGICLLLLLIGLRVYDETKFQELNATEKQLVGIWIVYRPVAGSSEQDQYVLTLNADRTSSAVAYTSSTAQWNSIFVSDDWSATETMLRFKDRSIRVMNIPITRNDDVPISDVTQDRFTWNTGKTTETLRRATEKEIQQVTTSAHESPVTSIRAN